MPNRFYTHKGQYLAQLAAAGITKPSKAAIKFDESLLELSDDEMRKLYKRLTISLLADSTPEERREILAGMDTCPCCDRWLGHNNPPADDGDSAYRRQPSFDFDGVIDERGRGQRVRKQ
jgi:hypothetical protein